MIREIRATLLICILCVLGLVSGCTTSRGTKMTDADLQKIVVGKTTRAEMLSMFGAPRDQAQTSQGAVAMHWYYSERPRVFIPFAATEIKTKSLNVMFDSKNVVQYFTISDSDGVSGGMPSSGFTPPNPSQ